MAAANRSLVPLHSAAPGALTPACSSMSWQPATKPGRDVWAPYFKHTQLQGPRRLLLETLNYLGETAMRPGFCVDLGAGTGAAARLIYERTRWQVVAVDASPSAAEYLCQKFGDECPIGIGFHEDSFETLHLPAGEVDLIWAGLSLPYVPQNEIGTIWKKIEDSLRPGGLFAGDFFGPQHGYAGRDDMNFQHPSQMDGLLRFMDVIKLERVTRPHPSSAGRQVMMDCYHVIARKP